MSNPVLRGATYEDLLKVPANLVAELIYDELYTSPRPSSRPVAPSSRLASGRLVLLCFVAAISIGTSTASERKSSLARPPAANERAADSDKRPTGFKGAKWGADEASVRAALGRDLSECMGSEPRMCEGLIGIGGQVVDAFMQLRRGGFGAVIMNFHVESYEAIKEVFLERYGRPSENGHFDLKTAMNLTVTNEVLVWKWNGVTIALMKYGDRLDRGGAFIKTREFEIAEERERSDRMAGAKDDLDRPSPPLQSDEAPRKATESPAATFPRRVGGDVTEPVIVERVEPTYPEVARKARISGIVIVECVIDKSGTVRDVQVLKGLPFGLDQAAIEAVKKWKFKPGTLNGQPVDVIVHETVNFTP